MDKYDVQINYDVEAAFDALEKDIDEIEDIIQKVYRAELKLDESTWNTKEKAQIDEEFLPYLGKFAEKYPNYLRARVKFAREAVQKHEELDKENAKLTGIDVI